MVAGNPAADPLSSGSSRLKGCSRPQFAAPRHLQTAPAARTTARRPTIFADSTSRETTAMCGQRFCRQQEPERPDGKRPRTVSVVRSLRGDPYTLKDDEPLETGYAA